MRSSHKLLFVFFSFVFFSSQVSALPQPTSAAKNSSRKPEWLLKPFLEMSETQPKRLLKIAQKLFSSERLRMVSVEAKYAFEWQHRLAMVGALSHFFDPVHKSNSLITASIKQEARELLEASMENDPSLLVRDGSVESVRRILNMDPSEAKFWKKNLESAFLNHQNQIDGEGLFIRETILTAMYESAMSPSQALRKTAQKDKNPQVRFLLKSWKTSAYDN